MPSVEAKDLCNSLDSAASLANRVIEDLSETPLPEDLPKAFPGVAEWLSVLPTAFTSMKAKVKAAKTADETPEVKERYQKMTAVVEECIPLAKQLQTYFNAVTADEDQNLAARLERYKGKVQDEKEGRRVETIMQETLERLVQLVSPSAGVPLEETEVEQLQKALAAVKKLPASLENTTRSGNYTMTNSGPGVMPIHFGERGVQHINAGTGTQISGDASRAQFVFGGGQVPKKEDN